MNKTITTSPEAFLSIGKNRLKIYSGKDVFLKDGTEFSIELYNPTSQVVAAKIYINGNSISSSLFVIKPGERSYLERFLDDNKKFLFETYTVEDSNASKNAIANNGSVKVEFFKEKTSNPTYFGTSITTVYPYYNYYNGLNQNNIFYTNSVPLAGSINTNYSVGTFGTLTTTNVQSTSTNTVDWSCNVSDPLSGTLHTVGPIGTNGLTGSVGIPDATPEIETGRVEKGGDSDQSFSSYYGNFEHYSFASVEYKILPESAKPVEIKNIRQYCGGCGNRIKKVSHKFCSNCGTEL